MRAIQETRRPRIIPRLCWQISIQNAPADLETRSVAAIAHARTGYLRPLRCVRTFNDTPSLQTPVFLFGWERIGQPMQTEALRVAHMIRRQWQQQIWSSSISPSCSTGFCPSYSWVVDLDMVHALPLERVKPRQPPGLALPRRSNTRLMEERLIEMPCDKKCPVSTSNHQVDLFNRYATLSSLTATLKAPAFMLTIVPLL